MCTIRYPFLDLGKVNGRYADEIKGVCAKVIDGGRYIGGKEVEKFEEKLARYVGSKHAIGVGCGLDALRLILLGYIALGQLREGDEVIVPSNTYIATILAVSTSRLKPVLVEPSKTTFNINPYLIEQAITPRTKAIITVHLYGRPSYDDDLADVASRYGLKIIEDNAQAIGASVNGVKTGHLGCAAAFSFYPTKNLGALGDGGAVTTDDDELAAIIRRLRDYGRTENPYENDIQGFNSRLDTMQAAVLDLKMLYIDEENASRRCLASVYDKEIDNHLVTTPDPGPDYHVYHQYVVRVKNRDRFRQFLLDRGIETAVHYPVPPHRQKCYPELHGINLTIAARLAEEVVSLPISPAYISVDDARAIAYVINSFR